MEFATASDAARALRATAFTFTVREGGERREVSVPMTVAPHRTKNSIKGIIRCFDLRGVSDEEITEGLSSFGVTHARRIESRRGGVTSPTDSIVLTFSGTDLPSQVTVGYVRVNVRVYIPNPMRCFRCQRFGHTRTHCRGRPTCSKCASKDHSEETCDADTLWCVNCGEGQTPHSSSDRSCPKYAEEREINALKATKNISFREARDEYHKTHPKTSYADKVKNAPTPASVSLDQMSAARLVQLLRSFGLTVVAAGAAAERLPSPPDTSASETQVPRPGQPASIPASSGGAGDGWTLVQSRRRPPPTQAVGNPGQSRPPTAVDEALRRGEEDRRMRDAKRARLALKAREARHSPGAESASVGSSGGASVTPETPQAVNPSVMGPPPPPPLPQRRPQPPLPAATPVSRPHLTASTASRQTQPPFAPGRPTKRAPPWETEGHNPRTRQHSSSGAGHPRSMSADGRMHREASGRPRIQFGESASSDAEERV